MPYFPYNRYPYSNFHDLNLDWILDTIQELYRRIISYEGSATPYDGNPRMDGTADPGTAESYARGDHRHPTDTSRMGKIEYYNDYGSTMVPYMDGAGSSGSSYKWAHEDHQHPRDSTKYDKNGGRIFGPVTVDGNLTAQQNMSVAGYLATPNFRAEAVGLEAGWHRVLEFSSANSYDRLGRAGLIINFFITRHSESGETHFVSCSVVQNQIKFNSEQSNALLMEIDKIRYTYDNEKAYVDIHLNTSTADAIGVDYNVSASMLSLFAQLKTRNLEAVAESPNGETVLALYDFSANIYPTYLKYVDSQPATYTLGSNHYVSVPYPSGLNGKNVVSIAMESWTSISAPISIMPYGNTNDTWYIIGQAGATLTNVVFRYWYI